MGCGVDTEANALLESLLAGKDFTLPEIDLDDPRFQMPGGLENEIYKPLVRIKNEELTEGKIDGNGILDVLMRTINAQIGSQFEKGRITTATFAEVYIGLVQGAMTTATSFVLGREQTYWQSINAQVAAIQAQVEIAKAKVQVFAIKMEALTQQATYALTKVQLASESMKYCLAKYDLEFMTPAQYQLLLKQTEGQVIQNDTAKFTLNQMMPTQKLMLEAQKDGVVAETGIKQFQLEFTMPKELELLVGRITGQDLDNSIKGKQLNELIPLEIQTANRKMELMGVELQSAQFNLNNMLPLQSQGLAAEVSIKQYERSDILPQKREMMIGEKLGKEIENEMLRFRRDYYQPQELSSLSYDAQIKSYTVNNQMPLDNLIKRFTHEGMQIDNMAKTFNLNNLLPHQSNIAYHDGLIKQQQVFLTQAQVTAAQYNTGVMLPAQVMLLREQYEAARGQTLNHRSDGTPITGGTMGAQKALNEQQVVSYQRDSRLKGIKVFTDAWTVMKSVDEGLAPPGNFSNTVLDSVLGNMRTDLALG